MCRAAAAADQQVVPTPTTDLGRRHCCQPPAAAVPFSSFFPFQISNSTQNSTSQNSTQNTYSEFDRILRIRLLKFDSEYIFLNFPFSQNGTLPSQWFHPAGRRRRRRRCRCLNSILHLSFFRKYDPPGPSTFPSRSPTTADAAARNPPDVRARSQQQPSPISSSMDYEGDGAAVASPGPPG